MSLSQKYLVGRMSLSRQRPEGLVDNIMSVFNGTHNPNAL